MLTAISWSEYLTLFAVLISGYYVIVVLNFYGSDLKALFNARNRKADPVVQRSENITRPTKTQRYSSEKTAIAQDSFSEIDLIAGKVQYAVQEAFHQNLSKLEFLKLIQDVLKNYPKIKDTDFQDQITELITAESAKLQYLVLNGLELDLLWSFQGKQKE